MKVTKEFLGVPDGEVHPRTYAPGDECPPELLEAAISLEAVDVKPVEPVTPPAQEVIAEQISEVVEAPGVAEEKADQPAENKMAVVPENKSAAKGKKASK